MSVLKKLGLAAGAPVFMEGIPEDFLPAVKEAGWQAVSAPGACQGVLAFFQKSTEVAPGWNRILKCLQNEFRTTPVWLAYPKNGAFKTDLSRDKGWEDVRRSGWRAVSLVSLNETWSALRMKPENAVPKNDKSEEWHRCIDAVNKRVTLPLDIQAAMDADPAAKAAYERHSFSHKREWVDFVLEAKKDATRQTRIRKLIETLRALSGLT